MRKQYYFRRSSHGLLAWDVDRLIRLVSALPTKRVPLGSIRELDGMHRVAKAALQGRSDIDAVQFVEDPQPDYVGLGPNDLPY